MNEAARAVAAAKAAFDAWSQTPVAERTGWLRKIHEKMEKRQEEIAKTISQEVGMPFKLSNIVQAGGPIKEIAAFADIADDYAFEESIGNSIVVKEPIGVVACITPWNFPLNQIVAKIALIGSGRGLHRRIEADRNSADQCDDSDRSDS